MTHFNRNLIVAAIIWALSVSAVATTNAVAVDANRAAVAGGSSVRATSGEVVVYFTRGEHFAEVERRASGRPVLDDALRRLFEGPTAAERRRGLRSSIPPDAAMLGAVIVDGIATINVSNSFAKGSVRSLQTRLAQLVYTATSVAGVDGVKLSVEGLPVSEFGEVVLDPVLTRASFGPGPVGGPPSVPSPGTRTSLVLGIQQRLIALGYLRAGADDGIVGPQTSHAILAFQGWEGLPRDGRATSALSSRLRTAERPVAARGPARRLDVSLRRQVVLLVVGGRTARVIHVSTGKPSSPTPPGRFRIFRKELRSWSVPFQVWLPYASYFNRGIAFHESPSVPSFPASAGCVRVPASEAAEVYAFARLKTPVIVRRS